MSDKIAKTRSSTKTSPLVTVVLAEDKGLADDYKELLLENEICATIKIPQGQTPKEAKSFAIMVPEKQIDKAYKIVESKSPGQYFMDAFFNPEIDE